MTQPNISAGGSRGTISLYLFFASLFCLLVFLGLAGQPTVHPYFDQVGTREVGTLFHHYTSGPGPVQNLVGRALIHVEGALQFAVLNVYSYAVGNLVPLTPRTMQFPNTIFAFLAAIVAFLFGRRLISERYAYCCALVFALGPWLGETLRQPWYFNTMSCLLHFSIFLSFVGMMRDPNARLFRIAGPVCVAAYLLTALDWPSFLFSLGLYFLLSGRLKQIVLNPYNLVPLFVGLGQLVWPLLLYLTDRTRHLHETMLLYPFVRYGDLAQNPDFWQRIVDQVLIGWGLQLVLAIAGLVLYVAHARKHLFTDRVERALFDSMCVWLIGAGYGLFNSSTSITYVYVAAMPTTLLGALILMRMRTLPLVMTAAVMAVLQIWITADRNQMFTGKDDLRVLAAATYLIEQRPDLLQAGKTAFLPRNVASNVGQYARGRNKRIVMPQEFPVERSKHAIGSPEPVLLAFVDTYEKEGKIAADWIVLDSELFSPDLQAAPFYRRLRDDPSVRWIARFKEKGGRELIVGEVTKGKGPPEMNAPLLDTQALARAYEAKYDRISFLKKNVGYVDHY